jgi:hypothetical protein
LTISFNRIHSHSHTLSQTVMLRSSCLSGRSFFWACMLPAQQTCFLYASPISLSNISHPVLAPWRAAMPCVRYCRLPRCALHPTPCGSPIQWRALLVLRPHPASRSILCHARSSSLHTEMLLVCY